MNEFKKIGALVIIIAGIYSCESSTFEEIGESVPIDETITYTTHVKTIIDANCVSCHNPEGDAYFTPLTTYEEVRTAVVETNLLERIQMQNGEPDIMPQTGGRMPQDKIDLIIRWTEEGFLE